MSRDITLAEGGGFEPPGPVRALWFSRPTQSSALPSFRYVRYLAQTGSLTDTIALLLIAACGGLLGEVAESG